MNCIPLPDELIRKVYGYILPIFDYITFMKHSTEHKKEEESKTFVQLLNRWYPNDTIETLDAKINYYDYVKEYAFMMNMRLLHIREFINNNPLFKKYAKGRVLEGVATTIKEQEKQVLNMEKDISKQREKKKMLHTKGNTYMITLMEHDLVYILKYRGLGCLNTIIRHCRMNKIPVIDEPYGYLQRNAAGWSCDKEYRNHLVRKLIAL